MDKFKETFYPRVSIVIPVYNGSDYLKEAIDSSLAQTYKNLEIIVVNDGSADDGKTERIALSYGDKIRYFNKENGWVSSALNLAIKNMEGDYFSWLSHDDVYYPQKIETQINFLRGLEDKSTIIYSDFDYIDKNSKFINEYRVKHIPHDSFRPAFIWGGVINGCTLLIPKKCFETCGVFNELLRTVQDYDLWFRFSEKYSFVHLSEILVKSRVHKKQVTNRLSPVLQSEENELYTHFILNIKPSEIKRYYKKPIPLFYIDYSIEMFQRQILKTANIAFLLGLINFWRLKGSFINEYIMKIGSFTKKRIKLYRSNRKRIE